MYDAVHALPSPYSEAQRRAWMPEPRQGDEWNARLCRQHIVIADIAGHTAGFMSLEPQDDASLGYVDFAYILPQYRGQGIFAALYGWIEARALGAGITRLTTHASLAARPAFEREGFTVTQEETVTIGAEQLRRFAMTKKI
ncbi:GNAT family N-acetyltransferase [Sphingorhabdus arenilitoris]|uniref:GNAT family N-acetyltransferase n=1 Tax=Sphingorhabdus arenilitoris TaxID=1490041 RepID=A0ABV8RJ45_9SPHN